MITPEEHQELLEMVSDYLFDQLDPEDRARMERHLAECGGCHAEVAALEPVADLLRSVKPGWSRPVGPPPELEDRILGRIRGESGPA